MSTTEPQGPLAYDPIDPLTGKKKRNWWIWVSAGLALALVGVVIALMQTRSDLDAAQKQAGDATASYKTAYEDLEAELGAAEKDLASTQQSLEQAKQDADEAEQAAEAAQQQAATAGEQADNADTAIDEADAVADQAKAEAKAAESQAAAVTDCANTFLDEIATVVQSADPAAAAAAAKTELQGVAADCREVLGR